MTLRDILQKILEESSLDIKKIEEECTSDKKIIDKEFAEKEKEGFKKLENKRILVLEKLAKEIDFMARKKSKNQMAKSKYNILQKVLDTLLKHLISLTGKDYEDFISSIIKDEKLKGTILVSSKNLESTKKVLGSNLSFEIDNNIEGGFIVKDHETEIDYSFENIVMVELKTEIESFIIKQLNLV